MEKISAIIVTHNPDISLLAETVKSLCLQLVDTIIIDNCSKNQSDLTQLDSYCQIHFLSANMGIAFAQNEGIEIALKNDSEGIIFLDQDSLVCQTMVRKLALSFDKLSKICNLAGIGPIHKDRRKKFFYPLIKINRFGIVKKLAPEKMTNPTQIDLIISSGSLISVQALRKVGLMNETLFIDYVDTEWCLRAKGLHYKFYVDPAVVLEHEIGESILKIWRWHVPVHSPNRRYYRLRNGFYLLRFSHFPVLLCLKEIIQNLAHQILLILVSGRRVDYLKHGSRGVRDGIYLYFRESKS